MGGQPDGDGRDRNGTKWKVNVEAPAPRNMVCERATEERTDHAGKGEHAAKATEEIWSVFEASCLADDSKDRDEDARGADTLYRPAKDEDVDVGANTADKTAELKGANREEVEAFGFRNGEELTECKHEPSLGDWIDSLSGTGRVLVESGTTDESRRSQSMLPCLEHQSLRRFVGGRRLQWFHRARSGELKEGNRCCRTGEGTKSEE